MNNLHFRAGHTDHAAELIEKHHYSGRMAANVQFVFTMHKEGGLFGDYGDAVVAATFSIPGTRWSESLMELTRLVKAPYVELSLTSFIALCFKHMKKNDVDLVVSFADWTQGHHGGVYQAGSWNYHGCREPRQDGLVIDGVFVPGRSCNSRWGTRSPSLLKKIKPSSNIEPHMDRGKHLYWRALTKAGKKKAQRLGLGVKEYPKPLIVEAAKSPPPEQLSIMEPTE